MRRRNIKQYPIPVASNITDYEDFVIVAQRTDARAVSVTIDASLAGRMAKAQKISFPLKAFREDGRREPAKIES